MNEKAYALYGRPLVRSMVNETTAELGRTLHPLRAQRWSLSDMNPMMWPLPAMASTVRAGRKPLAKDNPFRSLEEAWSDMITGSWNLFRDLRDAASEAAFFRIYGSMVVLGAGKVKPAIESDARIDPRDLTFVKEALSVIDRGGYPEAIARIGALVGRYAGPIPLSRLELADEFVRADKDLSKLSGDQIRSLRSDAGVMALLEPERTLDALPRLLAGDEDRERVMSILNWGLSQEGITTDQRAMIRAIIDRLGKSTTARGRKRKNR